MRGKHSDRAARRREDAEVQAEFDRLNVKVASLTKQVEVANEQLDSQRDLHMTMLARVAAERDAAAGPEVERLTALSGKLLWKQGLASGKIKGQLEFYRKMTNVTRERLVEHFRHEHGMTWEQARVAASTMAQFDESELIPTIEQSRFSSSVSLFSRLAEPPAESK